jgi:lantibiotic biosynthesis protein
LTATLRVVLQIKYCVGAERAFDYERYWFDHDAGNWPDFREEPRRRRRSNAPLSFAALWCHGAPGIALSRLRAFQILNDDTCKAEAITALHTTHSAIRRWLDSGNENYSLCHGLAGNAQVLLYGCQVLGDELTGDHELVAEVANAGLEMYGKRGGQWPCGAGSGETPNLMLGLAGIGYFYLRLYAPQIPSILILSRENF